MICLSSTELRVALGLWDESTPPGGGDEAHCMG